MEQVQTLQGFSEETLVDQKTGKTFPAFYYYLGNTYAFRFTSDLFTAYTDVARPEANVLFQPDMTPLDVSKRINDAFVSGQVKK